VKTGLAVAALFALAISGAAARAGEPPPARDGDVYLTYGNVDLYGSRFNTELLWVQPLLPWLDGQLGGHYSQFDDATWGHGIVGAHAWLPQGLGHLMLRYEGGAGDSDDTGHYAHHIGDVGWTVPVYESLLFLDSGLKLIRVDEVDEDLARLGLTVVPATWLSLNGSYHHSTERWSHGSDVWTARGDVTVRKIGLFAAYARSQDTLDLSSIGQGTVRNDPTDEYTLGGNLPLGRHGLIVSVSRFEGVDTRHTLTFTWRWSLAAAPWSFAGEPVPPPSPVPGAPGVPGVP
jgi:hypothetical protein